MTGRAHSTSSIQACCIASSFFSPQWLSLSSKPGKVHDPGHQIDKIDPCRVDLRVRFGKRESQHRG
jgi:endo-1,4-beta-D-glucanase Y